MRARRHPPHPPTPPVGLLDGRVGMLRYTGWQWEQGARGRRWMHACRACRLPTPICRAPGCRTPSPWLQTGLEWFHRAHLGQPPVNGRGHPEPAGITQGKR